MRLFCLFFILQAIASLKIGNQTSFNDNYFHAWLLLKLQGDIKYPVPLTSVKTGELTRILKDSLKIFYLASFSKIGQQECIARETIEGNTSSIRYSSSSSSRSSSKHIVLLFLYCNQRRSIQSAMKLLNLHSPLCSHCMQPRTFHSQPF